jgi:holin-like protein
MPLALAILIGSQLIGEFLRQTLHLPLPGPLIGMFLLAFILAMRKTGPAVAGEPFSTPLLRTANGFIAHMGLLFVPAGVGVIVELTVLRREWLPILAGLLVSTLLGLVVTGLVMHHVTRFVESRRRGLPLSASRQEAR